MPETMDARHFAGPKLADLLDWVRHMLRRRQTPEFSASIKKIQAIGSMRPGWNGHKASVPTEDVRQAAISFLRTLARQHFAERVAEASIVAPTSDGGVALEWRLRTPPYNVELIFLARGRREWAVREAKTDHTISSNDEDVVPSEADLLRAVELHVVGRDTVAA